MSLFLLYVSINSCLRRISLDLVIFALTSLLAFPTLGRFHLVTWVFLFCFAFGFFGGGALFVVVVVLFFVCLFIFVFFCPSHSCWSEVPTHPF